MSAVKQLLQQIELTKLPTLPDDAPAGSTQINTRASTDPFGAEESKGGGGGDLDFFEDPAPAGKSTADPFGGPSFPGPAAAAAPADPFASKPVSSGFPAAPAKAASGFPAASTKAASGFPAPPKPANSADPFASAAASMKQSNLFTNLGGSSAQPSTGGFGSDDPFASIVNNS